MSEEIRNADNLLKAVREQCGQARKMAEERNPTARNYLESAKRDVSLIMRIVRGYESHDDADGEILSALRERLSQAEFAYGHASKHILEKLGATQR